MAALDTVFTEHTPFAGGDSVRSCTAFTSTARTATPAPVILCNPQAGSLAVVIDVTAVSGSSSVVFTVEGVDRASGKTWVILTSAARVATGTTVLRVSPNISVSANLIAQDVVPYEFIIRPVHGTTDTTTYTVGVHLTA